MSFKLANSNDIKYYHKDLYMTSGQFIHKRGEKMRLKTIFVEQAAAVYNLYLIAHLKHIIQQAEQR